MGLTFESGIGVGWTGWVVDRRSGYTRHGDHRGSSRLPLELGLGTGTTEGVRDDRDLGVKDCGSSLDVEEPRTERMGSGLGAREVGKGPNSETTRVLKTRVQ